MTYYTWSPVSMPLMVFDNRCYFWKMSQLSKTLSITSLESVHSLLLCLVVLVVFFAHCNIIYVLSLCLLFWNEHRASKSYLDVCVNGQCLLTKSTYKHTHTNKKRKSSFNMNELQYMWNIPCDINIYCSNQLHQS